MRIVNLTHMFTIIQLSKIYLSNYLSAHPPRYLVMSKGPSFTVQKPSCTQTLCALGDSVALAVLETVKGHIKL